MLNLSEDLINYILFVMDEVRQQTTLECFSIFEGFSLPNYEDKYMDLIYSADQMDSGVAQGVFLGHLQADLLTVINQHGIELFPEESSNLAELIEIAACLLLLPKLEDKTYINYRVNSSDTSKNVLTQLLVKYSGLTEFRCMEMIQNVSNKLIEAIKENCASAEEDTVPLSTKHKWFVDEFFSFIGDTPCLGRDLREDGYSGKVSLDELLNLLPFHFETKIDKTLEVNPAQSALDILSVLVITTDDFEVPLQKFKEHSELFTTNTVHVTRLSAMMFSIVNDFNLHLAAVKESEKTHANDH